MRRIIKEGVKTRVLMLSATPVNNRLADLKNQIAFVTEGDDAALAEHGIASIEATVRQAQLQFNRWLDLEEAERKPRPADGHARLRLLQAARPAHHRALAQAHREILRHRRDRPIPRAAEADQHQARRRPRRRVPLDPRHQQRDPPPEPRAYAPLRYVLPHKQAAYDEKYSTKIRGGEGFFRQVDREESLVHLLRVNVLKRMESAVSSFALTLKRQLARRRSHARARSKPTPKTVEEIDIEDVDVDDPAFESLLVGRKVKVLLQDVDLVRWRQDLIEDRNRLATLLAAAAAGWRGARRQARRPARRHRAQVPRAASTPATARSSSSPPSPTPPSISTSSSPPGR